MTQKLITAAIKNAAKKYPLYSQDGKNENAKVLARFFTPASNRTWYMLEFDPVSGDAFGICVGYETEYGYFNVNELQATTQDLRFMGRTFGIQAIERDICVDPGKETVGDLMRRYGEEAPSAWAA